LTESIKILSLLHTIQIAIRKKLRLILNFSKTFFQLAILFFEKKIKFLRNVKNEKLEKKLSRERGVLQNLQECVLLFFWGKNFFPNYSVNKNVLQKCSAKMVNKNVLFCWRSFALQLFYRIIWYDRFKPILLK